MKNIFKYLTAALVGLVMVTSCEKFLDQKSPSSFNDETVFSNYTLAEQNIFNIHMMFGEQNSYRGRFLPWYGFNTDIEWYNSPKSGDLEKTAIAAYDIRVNNNQLNDSKNPFADMYSGIERANLVISGIRKYNDLKESPDMAYLLGEALTLRAMIYYDLVKTWGDVPARFEPLTSETMFVPRANRDVIYKQILADLEEAIGYLPYPGANQTVSVTYRVNKVFAEGLYARIALAASGYSMRPDDGKEGTGDLGTVRLSSDKELSKAVLYPKALKYLKDAISSNTCSLVEDYGQLWKSFNEMDMAAGKEILFSIPFGSDPKPRGRWNYTFAIKAENSSFFGSKTFTSGGTVGPTPNFWFRYDPRDTRRDITCVNYKWEKNVQVPAGINNWYFGKFRFEWMSTSPYSGGNDDGVKPVVMRYSDVLLMAAEIANEQGGEETFVKNCLKEVRTRAFKGNEAIAESYVNSLSGKSAIFEAIAEERALEFCGEFLRKADLIRWNRLYKALSDEKADLHDLATLSGSYSSLTGGIWYRTNEETGNLEIYGLGNGETTAPDGEWELDDKYISETKLKDIDLICFPTDESSLNRRQLWPIFQYIIDNSQGTLANDYNY